MKVTAYFQKISWKFINTELPWPRDRQMPGIKQGNRPTLRGCIISNANVNMYVLE